MRYDGGKNRFNYVWKTDPSWSGTCRKFVLTLVDGSTHEALFSFGKKHETERSSKPSASNRSRGRLAGKSLRLIRK